MTIFFRVDGCSNIGIGHIMRCSTLAIELCDKFNIVFICSRISKEIKRLIPNSITLISLDQDFDQKKEIETLPNILKDRGYSTPSIFIVDHYKIDSIWHRVFHKKGYKIVLIDDLANKPIYADILINQNLNAKKENYILLNENPECTYLIGNKYSLLRKEFCKPTFKKNYNLSNFYDSNILVSMGGADGKNQTPRILLALDRLNFRGKVTIIIGPASINKQEVTQIAKVLKYQCIIAESPTSMSNLMLSADIAIGAGGISNYERCSMGLAGFIIATADNQIPSCERLSELNCIFYAGRWDSLSDQDLSNKLREFLSSNYHVKRISSNSLTLFDNLGPSRIKDKIISIP